MPREWGEIIVSHFEMQFADNKIGSVNDFGQLKFFVY